MVSATPIALEQRGRTHRERMQEHADLARLQRSAPVPLTRLAQGKGTATVEAGSLPHTQAPLGFSALFLRDQLLVCRATHDPIGLEGKGLS
jgi:hypothetical protein